MATVATKRTTKRDVVNELRRFGRNVGVRENPKALNAEQRQALRERIQNNNEAIAKLKEELRTIGDPLEPLIKASRFVVDVDGGTPSIGELAIALSVAERFISIRDERRELEELNRKNVSSLHSYRFEAYRDSLNGPIPLRHILAQADDWDRLFDKLRKAATQ